MISNYLCILKINIKHNFFPHFLVAVIFVLLSPALINIKGLDAVTAARPIETIFALTGVLLLTPLCFPEHNTEINNVICSKKTSYLTICFLRLLYSLAALAALAGIFILIMYRNECNINAQHFYCALISAFILGALGNLSSVISRNLTAGYMVPLLFYVANYGGPKTMGRFYLFSMSMGSFSEKYILLGAGAICILLAFLVIQKGKSFLPFYS